MQTKQIKTTAALVLAGALSLTACGHKDEAQADGTTRQKVSSAVKHHLGKDHTTPKVAPTSDAPDANGGTAVDAPAGGVDGGSVGGSDATPSTSSTPDIVETEDGAGPTSQECLTGTTQRQAFDRSVNKVKPFDEITSDPRPNPWVFENSESKTYDPCTSMSWIVIAPKLRGVGSSPTQVMLFHEGKYVGTTLAEPQAYTPDITRVGDNRIKVVYRWKVGTEVEAEPKGRSVAYFAWRSGKVVQTGEVPPQDR